MQRRRASTADSLEQEAQRAADRLTPAIRVGHSPHHSGLTQMPRSVARVLASSGEPLAPALREEMEQRFNHDFSRVRVHHGADADRSAEDANAEAYTARDHIVFGAGLYPVRSQRAEQVLVHELTHVVQQSFGLPLLQRLIKEPYPWMGVITPKIGANIRNSPNASDPANILDSIPKGEPVKVLSVSGNWLYVESKYRGPAVTGYIHHTLVDDAATSDLAASEGTKMVWRPSGPTSGTDFQTWASAPKKGELEITASTVMNCWEAVLFSAYRSRAITWKWIHDLYTATPTANWVATMSRGQRRTYAIPGPNLPVQRGDLVFFNGLQHVALANGKGSEVLTFWPPPDTPFKPGGTPDRVKVFTIEELAAWWTAKGKTLNVEIGAPAW